MLSPSANCMTLGQIRIGSPERRAVSAESNGHPDQRIHVSTRLVCSTPVHRGTTGRGSPRCMVLCCSSTGMRRTSRGWPPRRRSRPSGRCRFSRVHAAAPDTWGPSIIRVAASSPMSRPTGCDGSSNGTGRARRRSSAVAAASARTRTGKQRRNGSGSLRGGEQSPSQFRTADQRCGSTPLRNVDGNSANGI